MSFMERQVVLGDWWECESFNGESFTVPADLAKPQDIPNGLLLALDQYSPYHERTVSAELVHGYGARLSAPGYTDCTEWGVYETEKAATEALEEMYPEDD